MIEYRALRQEELQAWFDHCAYVFSGGESNPLIKGIFINHFYMDPHRELEGILVAVEDGLIVSTVRIFFRKVFFFEKEVTVGGIGEVSTRPEHQGKGHAYRLLEMAIEQMKEKGIALSMLRGTAQIYSKLGWMKTTTYKRLATVMGRDDLAYRLRPVDLNKCIPELKSIHKNYSQKFIGAFTRDEDYYWRYWVKMESRNLWGIEDENDHLIGYIDFCNVDSCVYINEFCVFPSYDDIFDSVISKLCFMLDRKISNVTFESLIPSRQETHKYEKDESGMYRLINPIIIGNDVLNTTEQLINKLESNAMSSSEQVSRVLFWGIDSF
jgi:predicted acetyltransferase